MYINQIYGYESLYHKTLDSIKFFPLYYYPGSYDISWKNGHDKLKNLIVVMEEESSIIEKIKNYSEYYIRKNSKSSLRVFYIGFNFSNITAKNGS
jgi:hypothetical protein